VSYKELEFYVCGEPIINIKFLKKNSVYGCDGEDSEIIQWFWKAMNEYTNQ